MDAWEFGSVLVSIHAPARGATLAFYTLFPVMGFNPRPRAGGDFHTLDVEHIFLAFQSTPPRGGRPYPLLTLW